MRDQSINWEHIYSFGRIVSKCIENDSNYLINSEIFSSYDWLPPILISLFLKEEDSTFILSKEKIQFARVDSDHIDNLINKDKNKVSKLNDDQKKELEEIVKNVVNDEKFVIKLESMDSKENPFIITNPEFMRRMKDMQNTGGNSMFGNMPEMYNLVVNTNNKLISEIFKTKTKNKEIG